LSLYSVIQGKVEQINLPDDITGVDVIVSEWMGYALLYESMLDSVLHARDRFLKPEGVMAPSQCRVMLGLCAATNVIKERVEFWNDIYGRQDAFSDFMLLSTSQVLICLPWARRSMTMPLLMLSAPIQC
jgi:hypothetical protein